MSAENLIALLLAIGWAGLLPVWLKAAPRLRPRTCRLVRPRIEAPR